MRPGKLISSITAVVLLAAASAMAPAANPPPAPAVDATAHPAAPSMESRIEAGRRMYLEGVLPSGEMITARVRNDVTVGGDFAICGTCHRRSGLGSSEGSQVSPAIAGDRLFNPLRLPTRNLPLAPQQRPAYNMETLKRAIRSGVDANGELLDPLMPRYALDDDQIELLIDYLKTVSVEISPGVDERDIHFATIIAGPVAPEIRKALVDVMQVYVEQKNSETRHESKRAQDAPWHKEWLFSPYRKWVMHVWELTGAPETWPAQLERYYRQQPVFAVLSGVANGPWQPVHRFCEQTELPCLFPTTDLPVIAEQDFYPIYLSKGMALEGQLVNRHRLDDGQINRPLVQVYRADDQRAKAAAEAIRQERGVRTVVWHPGEGQPGTEFWRQVLDEAEDGHLTLWLSQADVDTLWPVLEQNGGPDRIYLSSSLYGDNTDGVPPSLRDRLLFIHTNELPSRLSRLLLRSTGWLRVKGIYAPEARQVQANAYFALKVAGDALTHIRGYFFRDYFIERIEHTVDSVPYTSVYPRISLAPGQRFAAKGGYIAKLSPGPNPALVAVTEWITP